MEGWRILRFLMFGCLLVGAGCTRTLDDAGRLQVPTAGMTSTEREASVSPTPGATAVADCVDDARFLEDVTVPDGSKVAPGQWVDKRWAMENTGTCDWGPGYRLVPLGDNPMAGEREWALFPARSGAKAIWQVQFEAPSEPGDYIGEWGAVNPVGESFGTPVFTLIVVEEGGG